MFGRATITVGIGPHSSFVSVLFAFVMNDRFSFLRSPYGIGQTVTFSSCFFFLLLFISSPNLSGRRLDVCHTSTHSVALVQI